MQKVAEDVKNGKAREKHMFCEDFGSRRNGSLGEAGRCRLGATDVATVAARAALNARRSERSGGKRHGFRLTAAGPRWTAVCQVGFSLDRGP